jgi:hypothetical protein
MLKKQIIKFHVVDVSCMDRLQQADAVHVVSNLSLGGRFCLRNFAAIPPSSASQESRLRTLSMGSS